MVELDFTGKEREIDKCLKLFKLSVKVSQDKSHRVLILQWLKGGNGYTEDAAIEALRESYPFGRPFALWQRCDRVERSATTN